MNRKNFYEKEISKLASAETAIRSVENSSTEVDVEQVANQLYEDKEKLKNEYLEDQLDTAIDNFVWNHEEEIQEFLDSDSLSEKVNLLNKLESYVMDSFGQYKPENKDLDDWNDELMSKIKEVTESPHAPTYEL